LMKRAKGTTLSEIMTAAGKRTYKIGN